MPPLDLPTDFERPDTGSFAGSAVGFSIAGHRYTALRELTRVSGSTLFIVLASIFNVFLSRLNGQEDIVVGTPVVGREKTGTGKLFSRKQIIHLSLVFFQ